MKNSNILEAVKHKYGKRITKHNVIDGNRKRLSELGLDDSDVRAMAEEVGLELEDLLLLSNSVTVISRPAPAKHGLPGIKNTTFDIACFARDRRVQKPQMTWNEIFHDWKRTFPDDKRVTSPETIREAYRRHFGDKAKAKQRVSKKP